MHTLLGSDTSCGVKHSAGGDREGCDCLQEAQESVTEKRMMEQRPGRWGKWLCGYGFQAEQIAEQRPWGKTMVNTSEKQQSGQSGYSREEKREERTGEKRGQDSGWRSVNEEVQELGCRSLWILRD